MTAPKEMLITFVYDLQFCKNEYADPLQAIVYFHPSWVNETQKLTLCGQLVGLMNFCSEFESVDFICLENGKFKFEKFGRFILAMGTDRNIQESILLDRSELLKQIIGLYHNNIIRIFEQENSMNFGAKLYQIFETYLPVLQHNSYVLQNIFKLHLPKSASNIFLNASQILESVSNNYNILGGMITYSNQVICTQFSPMLTKTLVASDPFRIKTTAERASNVNFHLPTGTQIIKIFITLEEYSCLKNRKKMTTDATSLGIQNVLPLPFFIKRKQRQQEGLLMKRDKFKFSHIPEEESPVEINPKRPIHLPLKLKTVPPESGIASVVSFDETDSYPEFIGKTTVAQTPLMLLPITPMVGPISSIFALNANIEAKSSENTAGQKTKKKEWKPVFISYSNNPFKNSVDVKNSCGNIPDSLALSNGVFNEYNVYNTITDPLYPIINARKKNPMSKSLFDDYQNLFASPPVTCVSASETIAKEVKNEPKKRFENDPMIMQINDANKNSPNRAIRNQKKKMLKLPIKSFSLDIDSGRASSSNGGIFDLPSTKRKSMGGLQLTPLMSKLTVLAMSENDENFPRELETPNYFETPVDNLNRRSFFNRLSKVEEGKQETANSSNNDGKNERCVVDLFIHGEKNLTLMIVADENSFDNRSVQQLFDVCVNRLNRLEQNLNDLVNVTYDLVANDYSFAQFDKNWDVVQKNGSFDLQSTLLMHDNFNENKHLSDIIVRTNDAIIYGHNSARTETYYQQSTKLQNGFPAPSEFTIISLAKRKLERDQSLVLF